MIPYRPPERAGGTESFTRCRAQTLSPSGEPGVRIERTECRQSESPKPEKSKSPKGMRAQTTQSFPVIRGIGRPADRINRQDRPLGPRVCESDVFDGTATSGSSCTAVAAECLLPGRASAEQAEGKAVSGTGSTGSHL
ncbi:hypothetical protein NDU88_004995 [Pleurodeles waltl]|uniref:Uncharacterized protein n=1 Tax=Pleurodeles waltl TaxID=8319 RepID=A0AAV7LJS0_PLEWA|nr:hypothetical protein NDU88_004995 [Pleurodeles waltl]